MAADVVAAEYLYSAGDPYLNRRMQAADDTNDVLLAMEWMPTVDGTVEA